MAQHLLRHFLVPGSLEKRDCHIFEPRRLGCQAQHPRLTRHQPRPQYPTVLLHPTHANIAVNTRMRPRRRLRHVPMLDRIVVDVINMRLQILIVPNQMLPIAALPNPTFSLRDAARTNTLILWNAARKARLDQRPARRVIHISRRQLSDCIKMIRQHHHGHNFERVTELDDADGFTQFVRVVDQQCAFAFRQRHGEEIGAAWD